MLVSKRVCTGLTALLEQSVPGRSGHMLHLHRQEMLALAALQAFSSRWTSPPPHLRPVGFQGLGPPQCFANGQSGQSLAIASTLPGGCGLLATVSLTGATLGAPVAILMVCWRKTWLGPCWGLSFPPPPSMSFIAKLKGLYLEPVNPCLSPRHLGAEAPCLRAGWPEWG